jgi:uncharacterized protein YbjT (DUF2867 family)
MSTEASSTIRAGHGAVFGRRTEQYSGVAWTNIRAGHGTYQQKRLPDTCRLGHAWLKTKGLKHATSFLESRPMILLTCAGSRTQRHVLEALQPYKVPIRAYGRSLDAAFLGQRGVKDIRTGDLLDRDALAGAMEGVQTVIHMGPPLQDKETTIGQFVIDAARRAGVARFIYISVIHPQIDHLMNHRAKLIVEDYLIGSRLNFTILQPQHYFQNIAVREVIAGGKVTLPYSMERDLGFVDMVDLGEAAALVATQPGHDYATYQISSSEHLSGNAIADFLSKISGKPVAAERMSIQAFCDHYARHFAPDASSLDWTIDAITRLFSYYDHYGIRGNGNVVKWLLGRPAGSFEAYVKRELAKTR